MSSQGSAVEIFVTYIITLVFISAIHRVKISYKGLFHTKSQFPVLYNTLSSRMRPC